MLSEHFPRKAGCMLFLGLQLFIQSTTSFATVIYQLREAGLPQVIGTLEVRSPPASGASGWSTSDLVDMVSLIFDDAVFGLGSDNLVATSTSSLSGLTSFNGVTLDAGSFQLELPTVLPNDPAVDPTISRTLSMIFDPRTGEDFLGLASVFVYPDGSQLVGDLFIVGDWALAVAEPGTFLLLGSMLVGLGLIVMRRQGNWIMY